MLGGNFHRDLVPKEWGPGGTERRVSLRNDSLRSEELHEFVVGVVQVKFELYRAAKMTSLSIPRRKSAEGGQGTDLVDGGNDGSVRKDLFLQLLLGEVRDANALDLSSLEQILHLLPRVLEFPIE